MHEEDSILAAPYIAVVNIRTGEPMARKFNSEIHCATLLVPGTTYARGWTEANALRNAKIRAAQFRESGYKGP